MLATSDIRAKIEPHSWLSFLLYLIIYLSNWWGEGIPHTVYSRVLEQISKVASTEVLCYPLPPVPA